MRSKCMVWTIAHKQKLKFVRYINHFNSSISYLVFRCTCEEKFCTLQYQVIEKEEQTKISLRTSLKIASPISAVIIDGSPDPSLLSMLPVSLYLVALTRLAFRFSRCRSQLIVGTLYPWQCLWCVLLWWKASNDLTFAFTWKYVNVSYYTTTEKWILLRTTIVLRIWTDNFLLTATVSMLLHYYHPMCDVHPTCTCTCTFLL